MRIEVERQLRTAAHQIVKLVSDWLREGDGCDHAFLEHPALEARAS